MAIIEEIDESLFISRFEDYNRVTRGDTVGNFTYKGLRHLFQYLDELSAETPITLDVIGLCCDYSEYKDLNEYLNNYFTTEEINDKIREVVPNYQGNYLSEEEQTEFNNYMEQHISDNTTLIKFDDDINEGFIIQQY